MHELKKPRKGNQPKQKRKGETLIDVLGKDPPENSPHSNEDEEISGSAGHWSGSSQFIECDEDSTAHSNADPNLKEHIVNALQSPPVIQAIVDAIYSAIYEKIASDLHDAFQLELQSKMRELQSLEDKLNKVSKNISKMESNVEEQEQYSRRSCLRFHGVKEKANETTDQAIINLAKEKMGITIAPTDIDRSHRLSSRQAAASVEGVGTTESKESSSKPRIIIVKFSRYNVRDIVYRQRTKLRGTNVYIHEDLTGYRSNLLFKARTHDNVKKTWTADGKITAFTKDGRKVRIASERDLEDLDT